MKLLILPFITLLCLFAACQSRPAAPGTTIPTDTTISAAEAAYTDTVIEQRHIHVAFDHDTVCVSLDSFHFRIMLIADQDPRNRLPVFDGRTITYQNCIRIGDKWIFGFHNYPAKQETSLLVLQDGMPMQFVTTGKEGRIAVQLRPATFALVTEDAFINLPQQSLLLISSFDSTYNDTYNVEVQERWFRIEKYNLKTPDKPVQYLHLKGDGNEYLDSVNMQAFERRLSQL